MTLACGDGDGTNFAAARLARRRADDARSDRAPRALSTPAESGGSIGTTGDIFGTSVGFATNIPADPPDWLIG